MMVKQIEVVAADDFKNRLDAGGCDSGTLMVFFAKSRESELEFVRRAGAPCQLVLRSEDERKAAYSQHYSIPTRTVTLEIAADSDERTNLVEERP